MTRRKKIQPLTWIIITLCFGITTYSLYLAYNYNLSLNKINTVEQSTLDFAERSKIPAPSNNDYYRWKSDSIYTVVVYFSMDCPSCIRENKTTELLKNKYKSAFSLVYRPFPLPFEPLAEEKAIITECVKEQSGVDEMFNFITDVYENRPSRQTNNNWVISLAKRYSKDENSFVYCLNSEKIKTRVNEYKKDGTLHGINGTPTIGVFKNGNFESRADTIGDKAVKRIMDYVYDLHSSGN